MKKFNVGDRVVVIDFSEIRSGVIRNIYPEVNTAIVAFVDGEVEKISIDRMALEKVETVEIPETEETHESEPVEKSEITITPDEFRETACDVLARETGGDMLFGIRVVPILVKICAALFCSEVSENSEIEK